MFCFLWAKVRLAATTTTRASYLRLGEVDKAALLLGEVLRGSLLVLPVAFVLEHLNLIGAAEIISATGRDVWHGSFTAQRRHHSSLHRVRTFQCHPLAHNSTTTTPSPRTPRRPSIAPAHVLKTTGGRREWRCVQGESARRRPPRRHGTFDCVPDERAVAAAERADQSAAALIRRGGSQ